MGSVNTEGRVLLYCIEVSDAFTCSRPRQDVEEAVEALEDLKGVPDPVSYFTSPPLYDPSVVASTIVAFDTETLSRVTHTV